MFDFLNRFFKKEEMSSRSARDRLQLVLIQDRAHVCPELMDSLRQELIQLISRYMVIDEGAMSMALERKEGAVALAASIPVINIRRTEPGEEGYLPGATRPEPKASRNDSDPLAGKDTESMELRRAKYLKARRTARKRRQVPGDE